MAYKSAGAPFGYLRSGAGYRTLGGVLGLAPAHSEWSVLSNDPEDFIGLDFAVTQLTASGALVRQSYIFTDGSPPTPPTVGIDVDGMTTIEEIAGAIFDALEAEGWDCVAPGPDFSDFVVNQPVSGSAGNTLIELSQDLLGLLMVNTIDTTGFDLYFYNGQSLDVPGRFGKSFALLPGPAETPPFVELIS